MKVVPNPLKEASNRRKHKLDVSRAADLLRDDHLVEADHRSLGYEHEGRLKITGRIGLRVFVLIGEPVEFDDGEFAPKPSSFRDADRWEARAFWTKVSR